MPRAGVDERADGHGMVRGEPLVLKHAVVDGGLGCAAGTAEVGEGGYVEVGSGEDVEQDFGGEGGEGAEGPCTTRTFGGIRGVAVIFVSLRGLAAALGF